MSPLPPFCTCQSALGAGEKNTIDLGPPLQLSAPLGGGPPLVGWLKVVIPVVLECSVEDATKRQSNTLQDLGILRDELENKGIASWRFWP
jgi:hypothetical protein